jgi:hypothetical protein
LTYIGVLARTVARHGAGRVNVRNTIAVQVAKCLPCAAGSDLEFEGGFVFRCDLVQEGQNTDAVGDVFLCIANSLPCLDLPDTGAERIAAVKRGLPDCVSTA